MFQNDCDWVAVFLTLSDTEVNSREIEVNPELAMQQQLCKWYKIKKTRVLRPGSFYKVSSIALEETICRLTCSNYHFIHSKNEKILDLSGWNNSNESSRSNVTSVHLMTTIWGGHCIQTMPICEVSAILPVQSLYWISYTECTTKYGQNRLRKAKTRVILSYTNNQVYVCVTVCSKRSMLDLLGGQNWCF